MVTTCLFALWTATAAPATTTTQPTTAAQPEWFGRMRELSETLTRLLVQTLPEKATWSATQQQRAVADASKLVALAKSVHTLSPNAAPDGDPSLVMMSQLFVQETERLERAMKRNPKRDRVNAVARGVATFCVGCHTRSDRLAQLSPLASDVSLDALHPLDRAELYMATHRFAQARTELDALLANDRFAEENSYGWEQAVTRALVLEVRTQRNPDAALDLVERVLNGPVPLARSWDDAESWRASLLAWKKEGTAKATTAAALLDEAERLVRNAEATRRVPGDRSADVYYLRATAAAHDLLAQKPSDAQAARAFSLLAVSYRRLRDVDVWSLARLYDEACIRSAPHTDLAQQCFRRYDDEIRADELGNGKGKLPGDIAAHLRELDALAAPEAPAPRRP